MNAIAIEAIEETNDMQSLNLDDKISNSDTKSNAIMYHTQDDNSSPEKSSTFHKANTQTLSDSKGANELGFNKKKIVS
jgi:hypothetical protein